jgi:RNA polymerase sigma factor (TIGR02999 family)
MTEFSKLLDAAAQGDARAADQLWALVYDELRQLAAQKLAHEKPGQTLDATALVNEAYLRLVVGPDQAGAAAQPRWQNRGHFLAAAAEAMRRILIDNARRKKACKHGGGRRRVQLIEIPAAGHSPDDLLALDDALSQLAAEDPEAAQVVRLRFYAGRSVAETADDLGISRSQAYRQWRFACAWLHSSLNGEKSADS